MPADADWPYLTRGEPIHATFKRSWEDFHVEEVPAILPDGAGDHVLFEIEKRGLSSHRAIGDIARAIGVRSSDIGHAGLKDARSVSRQWLSVEHVEPRRLLDLELPRIRVLRADRHRRKLRRGQLVANRFTIRLRDIDTGREHEVRDRLDILHARGAPNYYGPQRFGSRGDTALVGLALAREDAAEAAALIAGRPHPHEGADVQRARHLFDAGDYGPAARAWPPGYRQVVRLVRTMDRTGDPGRAVAAVGKRMLRFYASAWQSWLFNHVVAARIATLDTLLQGDLAWVHAGEALFEVEKPGQEQPRADRFEVSPTGPLVGRRPRLPGGTVRSIEDAALRDAGFDSALLESRALRPLRGRRRPLRVRPESPRVTTGRDDDGAYLELQFTLTPGCYATVILREIGKGALHRGTAAEYLR